MKKVLITGANSYIGTSFEEYVGKHYASEIEITTIDMIDGRWGDEPFHTTDEKPYDCVFHVAGLAHADIGNVDETIKQKYYSINTDLAIKACRKAKEDGVRQFIFMSSMIVYGKQEHISKDTKPHPANFYGDSKWKADKGVRRLASDSFTVTVLRPPMIYGKGSKGNYPILSKLAKCVPFFPDYQNRRSMLYIENLCEFLCQIMIGCRGGIFWPQNSEYSSTSDIVREIARVHGRRMVFTKALNPAVSIAKRFPVKKVRDLSNKAFGDSWYEAGMSKYENIDYQRVYLRTSIKRTEEINIWRRNHNTRV